ncbi:MAG: FHA domain-containing protein, partial [Persicimonas sp.]
SPPAPEGIMERQSGSTPVLVVQSPKGTMETRHEVASARFLLGRKNCDLLIEDPFVSDFHAQLFRRDGALVLQDLGSKNGVFLRIADDLMLENGDEIIVGQQRLVFRIGLDDPREEAGDRPRLLGAPIRDADAHLVRYLEGGQTGGAYPLSEQTSIGGPSADVSFEDDPLLSPEHAVVRRTDKGFALRDADSQTGTYIRIADAVELIDGDCFLIGRTRIRLTGV